MMIEKRSLIPSASSLWTLLSPAAVTLSDPNTLEQHYWWQVFIDNQSVYFITLIKSTQSLIKTCEEIQRLHQESGYPIVRDEIEDHHPTPGSLGSYASEKPGVPVLTYECPIFNEHYSLYSI